MELDWTTFALEVLNFLVLVWLLKRFFYRPVLAAIDARQARVKKELDDADRRQAEGESLRRQYEARLAEWAEERERLRRELEEELARQRTAGMERVRKVLADEEDKARARESALTQARERELLQQARGDAYANVASMLGRLASPALTSAIAEIVLEDLRAMPEGQRAALREALGADGAPARIEITAAHPLAPDLGRRLAEAVGTAAERGVEASTRVDPALIAGLRIAAGECVMHANLVDELAYFRQADGGH